MKKDIPMTIYRAGYRALACVMSCLIVLVLMSCIPLRKNDISSKPYLIKDVEQSSSIQGNGSGDENPAPCLGLDDFQDILFFSDPSNPGLDYARAMESLALYLARSKDENRTSMGMHLSAMVRTLDHQSSRIHGLLKENETLKHDNNILTESIKKMEEKLSELKSLDIRLEEKRSQAR